MKTKKWLSFLFLLSLLTTACQTGDEPAILTSTHPILGTWRWQITQGGLSGRGTQPYPEELGKIIEVSFHQDGSYQERVGGQVKLSTTFRLEEGKSIHDGKVQQMVRYGKDGYGGGSITQNIYFSADTLYLRDNVYDGYVWVYRKIKEEGKLTD
jgi:hypothetical protein